MYEDFGQTADFRLILGVAESLRGELGINIDAHPGSATIEPGQVNRAFQVMARCIVQAIVPAGADLSGVLTCVLRQVAERRLGEAGVSGALAGNLLDLEPELGDRWFAYLALSPRSVIEDLLGGEVSR